MYTRPCSGRIGGLALGWMGSLFGSPPTDVRCSMEPDETLGPLGNPRCHPRASHAIPSDALSAQHASYEYPHDRPPSPEAAPPPGPIPAPETATASICVYCGGFASPQSLEAHVRDCIRQRLRARVQVHGFSIDDLHFCDQCGQPVDAATLQLRVCTKCGEALPVLW